MTNHGCLVMSGNVWPLATEDKPPADNCEHALPNESTAPACAADAAAAWW